MPSLELIDAQDEFTVLPLTPRELEDAWASERYVRKQPMDGV